MSSKSAQFQAHCHRVPYIYSFLQRKDTKLSENTDFTSTTHLQQMKKGHKASNTHRPTWKTKQPQGILGWRNLCLRLRLSRTLFGKTRKSSRYKCASQFQLRASPLRQTPGICCTMSPGGRAFGS